METFKCEVEERLKSGNKKVQTHTFVIPKAELVLSTNYLTCSKGRSCSSVTIDIKGAVNTDSVYETYELEILNATSKDTKIRDFDNNKDNKFKVKIGQYETADVVYVRVTASYQGTEFTQLLAIDVQ